MEKNEKEKLEELLNSPENRKIALEKAKGLWTIMTRFGVNEIYTTTEVVRNTNLTHKEARELLNMLSAFGYITWKSKHEFRFILSSDDILKQIDMQIDSYISIMIADIDIAFAKIRSILISEGRKEEEIEQIIKQRRESICQKIEL